MIWVQLVDYHVHTHLCGHAEGSIEKSVAHAKRKQLSEIGFAGHFPILHLPEDDDRVEEYAMSMEDIPSYLGTIMEVRLEHPEVCVRTGFEVDYVPGCEDRLKEELRQFPLDFVMGSVHFIDDWSFDDPRFKEEYERRSLDQVWTQYFELVWQAARSGLFDVMAHLDLIKKFNHYPRLDLRPIFEETARVLSVHDLVVEVNTAGLTVPAQEIYPSRPLLEACYCHDVPVTLGSDAHHPSEVGRNLRRAVKTVKEVGYDRLAVFQERQREFRFIGR